MNRRDALKSLGAIAAAAPLLGRAAKAEELSGYPTDMALDQAFLPTSTSIRLGGKMQVLADEGMRRTVAAVFDRLIPGDALGPSASEAGCVDFLDAQLAGSFGQASASYREKPLQGDEEKMMQVPQFIATPRERYEAGIKALNTYCRTTQGMVFADLKPQQQDEILTGMEKGTLSLPDGVPTKAFFELMLQNVKEGYFADPIYGGNKDMAGWKMIGFPGARYDYRLYVDRISERLDLEPVSLIPKD